MSSISNKLTYLNTTKEGIKTALNSMGASITDDAFRDYVEQIDEVYDNWERVTGEGASVSLSNTLRAKAGIILNGNTEQVTTTGKNLFDKDIGSTTGSLKDDGSIDSDLNYATYNFINLSDIGINDGDSFTYSLTNAYNTGSNISRRFQIYDANNNIISNTVLSSYTNGETSSQTFSKTSSMVKIRFSARKSDINVQIEKGASRTSYEPYSGGFSSPSPDYPQNIKTVTSVNSKITIIGNGLNLFNKTKSKQSSSSCNNSELDTGVRATATRAGTSSSHYYFTILIDNSEILLGKTVNISATITPSASNQGKIKLYWSRAGSMASQIGSSALTQTGNININIPSSFPLGCDGIIMVFYANEGGTNAIGDYVDYTNVKLGTGSSATPYTPFVDPNYIINLGVKNLFNINDITEHLLINEDGTENPSSTVTSSSNYIPVYPNKTYTESFVIKYASAIFRVHLYDKNKNWIAQATSFTSQNKNARQNFSFTTTGNTRYIRITFRDSDNVSQNAQDIQIEIGDTANNYVSYGVEPIELCKIDTNEDYIYKNNGKWYINKEIGKIVLDGTESWTFSPSGNVWYISSWCQNNNAKIPKNNDTLSGAISDYYENITRNQMYNYEKDYGIGASNSGSLNIVNKDYNTSSSNFAGWLSAHNTTVYYLLATPTNTEITNSTLIEQLDNLEAANSYTGNTYILSTNSQENVPFIISASALKKKVSQ